jgi:hypothetical protein
MINVPTPVSCSCWCSPKLHPLSLFVLCSRTNKDRRRETTTGVESRDTGSFAGRRTERRRGHWNTLFFFSFFDSQCYVTTSSTQRFLYGANTCARTHIAHLAHAHTPLSSRLHGPADARARRAHTRMTRLAQTALSGLYVHAPTN